MNTKIEKICAETARLEQRISADRVRLRELNRQKTELENTEILRAVRAVDISLDRLPELLRAARRQENTWKKEEDDR